MDRKLPDDLPTSLDDRRSHNVLRDETEIYDAWQGQAQVFTAPVAPSTLTPGLSYHGPQDEIFSANGDNEDQGSRLSQMLAAQTRLKEDTVTPGNEEKILQIKTLSDAEKKELLHNALTMAASNGDAERLRQLLCGPIRSLFDVNGSDNDGTPPIIYASCFGHEDAVLTLIENGAKVDAQDKNNWSALMWAMTNHNNSIAKLLLYHGASPNIKSSSGRTAFDFAAPDSDMSEYLQNNGYQTSLTAKGSDFYNPGFSQELLEEELADYEMRRRLMMESAVNLEVDIGNLGLDEKPETPDSLDEVQEFSWDRCLNDQMFVFQEKDLLHILTVVITNMTPQRSPSQKPVPANIIFLGARYAHYHTNQELVGKLLTAALDRISDVVERNQWDMTLLAFWMSNSTILLHYLKKDHGLQSVTSDHQTQIAELINEIYILIIRDAERRLDKILDQALLDHETIPGFEDVHFKNEWKIFRGKSKAKAPESIEAMYRPPSPKRRAQISPRNVTSLLSSTLFVLDLYDIHSVIATQIVSQLFYWLGAELFNRIMSTKKYLARTKAMQIRMNISVLEDWARMNSRKPEHYENGSMISMGENTVDSARRYLAPTVQLLQWLQCFSSLGDDFEALVATLQQLPRLVPRQLLHAANNYRAEVGEKGLPKSVSKYLHSLQEELIDKRRKERTQAREEVKDDSLAQNVNVNGNESPETLLYDPAYMLQFALPSSTDMLVTYGAGFGGVNKEQARKYVPSVPPEILAKFDFLSSKKESNAYEEI